MVAKLVITPQLLSDPFWDNVLMSAEDYGCRRDSLKERLLALEALRDGAAYNTGSISFTAAWCLYALAVRYQFQRVIEVGTFIGKSTVSMASGMDDVRAPGEIFTCDASNNLDIPWDGRTRIQQHRGETSTQMLAKLDGVFDFAFLDGRLAQEDLPLLDKLSTPETIIGLDDFEGGEKGVVNLSFLTRMEKFRRHLLLYPPSRAVLQKHGLSGHSLTALLFPPSRVSFARQG